MPLSLRSYISSQFHKLKTNLFFQNVALITGGTAAAKAIGILSAPVITRLYTPEDYGVFSVFAAIMGVASTLATLRYAVTIPLPDKEEVADNIIRLSFLITIVLSILWALLILFFGAKATEVLSVKHLAPYLWVLPIAFFFAGVYNTLSNWGIRNKFFRLITKTKVSQGISLNGSKIALGAFGIAPLGLLIGLIVSQAAGTGSLFLRFIKKKPLFFKRFVPKDIKEVAIRYKKFPLVQSWSQLLLGFGAQLPVFFIAAFHGTEVVGLFGLAHNLISMPMNLLGTSVSKVYYGEIAKYAKSNPEKTYALSVSIVKKMFLLAVIPIALIIIAGPWAFGLIFGELWQEAGVFARVLAFIILTRFISSPLASVFNVYEMQGTQLFFNVLRVALVASVFVISNLLGISPLAAVAAYSVVMTTYYLFLMYIIFRSIKTQSLCQKR